MMKTAGERRWVIPGGNIPERSTGIEPDFLSQDRIAILNTGVVPAIIKLTLYYPDKDPVVYSTIEVKARRLRKIRINDLINPFPVFLGTDYSIVIEADQKIIVQFSRMDTGSRYVSIMGSLAFYCED